MRTAISCLFINLLLLLTAAAVPHARRRMPLTILPQQYAVNEGNTPCYICAAEWKFRQRNNAIGIEEDTKLYDDDEKCCAATVVRDVEETLETMNPAQWENTAINGELLKQDTDRLLDGAETMSMSMLDYKRQLDALEGKWRKYRAQQDFNKWAALRHWLRIPGIRRRIETVEKDIRGETSRRSRRLQERIRKAEKLMEQTKNKLRDIYAIYHREGKSRFSECNLKRRIAVAIQRKNTHLQKSVRQTTAFHKFKQQTIGKAFRRGKSY